jgi:hypothetical protein
VLVNESVAKTASRVIAKSLRKCSPARVRFASKVPSAAYRKKVPSKAPVTSTVPQRSTWMPVAWSRPSDPAGSQVRKTPVRVSPRNTAPVKTLVTYAVPSWVTWIPSSPFAGSAVMA